MRRADPLEEKARGLATAAGLDPDVRVPMQDDPSRTMPTWCNFRDAARAVQTREKQDLLAKDIASMRTQPPEFQNAPLKIFGEHDEQTITQMRNCMAVGNVVAGVICADGHLGYAQPVGGVIGYEGQISISGVGFDISCGNGAIRLDTKFSDIRGQENRIIKDVARVISFGIGRTNDEKVEHELFDDAEAWKKADMEFYRPKAEGQLGTVGSGNHYVDIMYDEEGYIWVGVHFGSRGLGHTSTTKYLKLAGGKDGMFVPPTVLDENSELGQRYIAAMQLGGKYAYAGREWVMDRVRKIIGGKETERIHNHHNFAWKENHNGKDLWVVRKGATPAFPGQKGFVGGSMGDDAVIIEGVDSAESRASLYSTVHGAGRLFGRKEAKRRFTKHQMSEWLNTRGVTLIGGDLDESPMAYRRLPEVLAAHTGTIRVLHTLRPFAVAMAGEGEHDPWKD